MSIDEISSTKKSMKKRWLNSIDNLITENNLEKYQKYDKYSSRTFTMNRNYKSFTH